MRKRPWFLPKTGPAPVLLTFHEYRQAMQEVALFDPATVHADYKAHCAYVRMFEV